jgi:aminoglycoside phosphotransferase (APT) family kinase protein
MVARLRESNDGVVRDCLERALAETLGQKSVVAFTRRPFAYETSFAIDELRVGLDGGETLTLLVKDVGATGLSRVAAEAKPALTIEPEREIAVYRTLLAGAELSTARFYGAEIDRGLGRWWLFLERVEGEVLADVGEISVWRQAAAWSALLGPALERARPPDLDRLLLHRDADWHRRWIAAALAAIGGHGSAAGAGGGLAERLRRHSGVLVERLEALPRAFVHGELYASNVLVRRGGEGSPRIAPVDWELAGTGPYALDLAALVSGWNTENRLVLCHAYHDALPAEVRSSLGFGELTEATNLCRLALALQWIGWAPGWRAPEPQRRDWTAEASELLDELDLP